MHEQMFHDVGDTLAHIEDDLREGNFKMPQSEQQRTAKNELVAMRHQVGMLKLCYQEMQATLEQAFQCLAHGSIAPADADAVRSTVLILHAQLWSIGAEQADTILKQIHAERCRLSDLSDARERGISR
jgi:hypothetical protein